MTHVNLDTQPEVVRQFVLALSASADGAVLESEGRPVACVIPPPSATLGAAAQPGEWTEQMNRRRCELINRKHEQGLTPSEEAELALLQDATPCTIDKVAPLPLDAARKLHQELLDTAAPPPGGVGERHALAKQILSEAIHRYRQPDGYEGYL